jgi:hypothetical protein
MHCTAPSLSLSLSLSPFRFPVWFPLLLQDSTPTQNDALAKERTPPSPRHLIKPQHRPSHWHRPTLIACSIRKQRRADRPSTKQRLHPPFIKSCYTDRSCAFVFLFKTSIFHSLSESKTLNLPCVVVHFLFFEVLAFLD